MYFTYPQSSLTTILIPSRDWKTFLTTEAEDLLKCPGFVPRRCRPKNFQKKFTEKLKFCLKCGELIFDDIISDTAREGK